MKRKEVISQTLDGYMQLQLDGKSVATRVLLTNARIMHQTAMLCVMARNAAKKGHQNGALCV